MIKVTATFLPINNDEEKEKLRGKQNRRISKVQTIGSGGGREGVGMGGDECKINRIVYFNASRDFVTKELIKRGDT